MGYVEKHLIPGETVQYQTKLHWVVMLGYVLAAAVLEFLAIESAERLVAHAPLATVLQTHVLVLGLAMQVFTASSPHTQWCDAASI